MTSRSLRRVRIVAANRARFVLGLAVYGPLHALCAAYAAVQLVKEMLDAKAREA
jgi:hypothetical protein